MGNSSPGGLYCFDRQLHDVLWPRRGRWIFRIDPAVLAGRIAGQPEIKMSGWYRGLSEEIGSALDTNDESLKVLYYWFEAASGMLLVEIVFWILDVWRMN
jgi:hypothetical protein